MIAGIIIAVLLAAGLAFVLWRQNKKVVSGREHILFLLSAHCK